MNKQNLEQLLYRRFAAFNLLNDYHKTWASLVSQGDIDYDRADDRTILNYYRDWLTASEEAKAELDRLCVKMDWAEEFLDCYRQVRDLLTPKREALSRVTANV